MVIHFPLRIHEYLEIVQRDDGERVIRCLRCNHEFCEARENYKKHALRRARDLSDPGLLSLATGEPSMLKQIEYICPGCATLLEVDVWCPAVGEEGEPVWDIRVKVD